MLVALLAVLALILYACSGSSPTKGAAKPPGVPTGSTSTSAAAAAAGGAAVSGGSTGSTGSTGPTGSTGSTGGTAATGGTTTGGTTAGGTSTGGTTTGGTTTGGTTTAGTTTGGATPTGGACDLTLSLLTRAAAYAIGEKPDFTVAVSNKGTVDCTADLGPKSLVLTIYSGADRIWSSADCGGQQDLRAVAPNTVLQVPFNWSRVRSQPGCSGPATAAAIGTYYATATLATGTGPAAASFSSQQQSFQLKNGS